MPADLVSIIIPTYNRTVPLLRALESISHQRYVNHEIVVVDDASTDLDCEAIRRAGKVRIVRVDARRGPSYARNLGTLEAKGVYVWFLDSDVVLPDDGTLGRLVTGFASSRAIGSLGGEVVAAEDTLGRAYGLRFRWNGTVRRVVSLRDAQAWTECDYLATCNCFTRRDYLRRIGGFDEQFVFGAEDADLGRRLKILGLRNYVSYAFSVVHCHEGTGRYADETRRYHNTRILFAKKHFGVARLLAIYLGELVGFVSFYAALLPKLLYRVAARKGIVRENVLGGWYRFSALFAMSTQPHVSSVQRKDASDRQRT